MTREYFYKIPNPKFQNSQNLLRVGFGAWCLVLGSWNFCTGAIDFSY